MTALSDTTLRTRLADHVPTGTPAGARHCAYEFTAATVYKGAASEPHDVLTAGPVTIEPTELVWIKAKEQVRVPHDEVGLWVQTQTLSKKGLLLLNTSLIEPGYDGPLHAVFANFGQASVPITAQTRIAKVIFFKLDAPATDVLKQDTSEYDRSILEVSVNSPETFMHLRRLAETLRFNVRQGKKVLRQASRDAQVRLLSEASAAIQAEVEEAKKLIASQSESERNAMAEGVKRGALRWGGMAVAGFLAGLAAVWLGMSVYLPRVAAYYSDVDSLAKKAVEQQAAALEKATLATQGSQAALVQLRQDLRDLKNQQEALEKRLSDMKGR